MKALLCKEFGPVSQLSWEETADPIAGPNEIVIDIKVCKIDTQKRSQHDVKNVFLNLY